MTLEARTSTKTPQPTRLADYRPPAWWVGSVELDFELGEEKTFVTARLAIRRNVDGAGQPLVLDGQGLTTHSLSIDGRALASDEYEITNEHLSIAHPPESFTLETLVEIHPEANTALEGLYKSAGNFCTQCEAEGFRRITWFPDRPDVMATYRTVITADKARYPVLLSNGNLVESSDLGDGRHHVVWSDPWPKPSYLFALVAGDLAVHEDVYVTGSGREVACRIYVERGNEDRCVWAMESLKNAMRWDEEVFGLEYDLDIYMIVAVSDFNMGAMENKGLNV
jgi:aminopeptidase N